MSSWKFIDDIWTCFDKEFFRFKETSGRWPNCPECGKTFWIVPGVDEGNYCKDCGCRTKFI
jgi:hypothetical protein